jgi:hypothetical protein
MFFRFRTSVMIVILALGAWVSFMAYSYFFDHTLPEISLTGLECGGHYCGELQAGVMSNKNGGLSVWLDGNKLINRFKIKGKQEHPFAIPTGTIANGKHTIKAELVDNTFRANKTVIEKDFIVDNLALQAAFVKSDSEYKVFQGRTLHVQFQVNKEIQEAKVHALAKSYVCFPESKNSSIYECCIPVSCEENPNEYLFTAEIKDRVGNSLTLDNKFQVVVYPFKKQNLHVTAEKIAEEKELGITGFAAKVQELTEKSPKEKLWRSAFCTPIDVARVACEYGTVRTTQEKGRYVHKALDVINTPKCVVWAPQDGIVVLKERYADSGNTVVIDHGWGVLSMLFHLEDFADIHVGQKIAQGNPVGRLGKTGYATGYHLHWEMRINNIPVDPMQWTQATF